MICLVDCQCLVTIQVDNINNMCAKVAVVTGSNKGIGFDIVKGLCQKFDGVVYLTSRDEKRGLEAVKKLDNLGFKPKFHILDVGNRASLEAFRDHIVKEYGYIDLIVNNAAVICKVDSKTYEEVKYLLSTNYYGVLNVADLLYPLLRENGRVVNVSSDCGHLSNVRNKYWFDRLSNKNLTVADVNEFVEAYLESVKKGTVNVADFADNARFAPYRVSKVGLCALTIVHQREYAAKNISINSCHPGHVRTDMTGSRGFYSSEEGTGTPLYLALDAPQDLKGSYLWHDKTLVDWYDYNSDRHFVAATLF